MGYPFWSEPPRIVHFKEYPPGPQQEAITTVCAVFEEFHQRSPPVPTSFKRNAQSDSARKVVSICPNLGAVGRSDGPAREWSALQESQGRTFDKCEQPLSRPSRVTEQDGRGAHPVTTL